MGLTTIRQGAPAVGFAGFASLKTDVATELAIAASKAAAAPRALAPSTPSSRQPTSDNGGLPKGASVPPAYGQSSSVWVKRGFWGVVGVGTLLYIANVDNKPPSSTPSWTPKTTYPVIATETVPSAGTGNTFNESEIRYCVSQDIRIEGARAALNQFVNSEVDRFNAIVADYNSRCSNFRYRKGALERLRAEAQARKPALFEEGAALIRWSR